MTRASIVVGRRRAVMQSARAHVNTNPRLDLRRLPRKYDVKITSQSQTGLPRDHPPSGSATRMPGRIIYYDVDGRSNSAFRRVDRATSGQRLRRACATAAICKWSRPGRMTVARSSKCARIRHTNKSLVWLLINALLARLWSRSFIRVVSKTSFRPNY